MTARWSSLRTRGWASAFLPPRLEVGRMDWTMGSPQSTQIPHSVCKKILYLFWLRWVFVAVRKFSLAAGLRLLTAVVSLIAEHRSKVHRFGP